MKLKEIKLANEILSQIEKIGCELNTLEPILLKTSKEEYIPSIKFEFNEQHKKSKKEDVFDADGNLKSEDSGRMLFFSFRNHADCESEEEKPDESYSPNLETFEICIILKQIQDNLLHKRKELASKLSLMGVKIK